MTAVVVLVIFVILVIFLYRRTPSQDKGRNISEIQNPAYEGETQLSRKLPQVPYSESGYEEPAEYAQLDILQRVPMDANYQSLKREGQQRGSDETKDHTILKSRNENAQEKASLGSKPVSDVTGDYVTIVSKEADSEVSKESLYEELP